MKENTKYSFSGRGKGFASCNLAGGERREEMASQRPFSTSESLGLGRSVAGMLPWRGE